MEKADMTLKDRIKNIPLLTANENVQCLLNIGEVLKTAHRKKLFHSDIKPSNILIYHTEKFFGEQELIFKGFKYYIWF